jgi:hypothetical protein
METMCIACGMPMTKATDFAMGDTGKDLPAWSDQQ